AELLGRAADDAELELLGGQDPGERAGGEQTRGAREVVAAGVADARERVHLGQQGRAKRRAAERPGPRAGRDEGRLEAAGLRLDLEAARSEPGLVAAGAPPPLPGRLPPG